MDGHGCRHSSVRSEVQPLRDAVYCRNFQATSCVPHRPLRPAGSVLPPSLPYSLRRMMCLKQALSTLRLIIHICREFFNCISSSRKFTTASSADPVNELVAAGGWYSKRKVCGDPGSLWNQTLLTCYVTFSFWAAIVLARDSCGFGRSFVITDTAWSILCS